MFTGATVVISIMKLATCGTVSLTLINAVKFFNNYEMGFKKNGKKGGNDSEVTIDFQELRRKN